MEKNIEYSLIETNKNLIGANDPIPQENIGDSILNAFKFKPDFIGQVDADTEKQITFQQMRENSVKCALWLKKVGVKKGDVVTICTRNPSIAYVPFLASLYIGAIVNPWEENYFRDTIRVMYFLVKNKPDVIFVDSDNFIKLLLAAAMLKSIKKIIKIVTIDKIKFLPSIRLNSLETILNDDFDKAEIDNFSCEKNCSMDIAIRTFSSIAQRYPGQADVPYIAFTSPSNKQTPVMIAGDTGLWFESLCWTHGPLLTVHAILSYVTSIKYAIFSERNLFKAIEKYKVKWVFFESGMCNDMFQTNEKFLLKYDTSSLKTVLFDNWSMHQHIHEELLLMIPAVSVVRVYSKPETGVIAYQRFGELSIESAGNVTKNVQIGFYGHCKKDLIPKNISAIYCKTPYTTRCKYATECKEQPWFYTADRGFYDKDGKISVVDISKENIRYKNYIISPGFIESLIRYHPAVSDVIVTSVRHPIDYEHLVAYVKIKPEVKVTEKELMKFVENNAHDNYKIRGGLYIITHEIPRFPNGKINREHFRLLKATGLYL